MRLTALPVVTRSHTFTKTVLRIRTGYGSASGNYLIAINGKQVKAGDNYWQLLNNRLNRKSEVTFNSKPSDDGAWVTRIETISTGAYGQLRYERWVKERRKKVDELSGGRIGYLHIQAMNQPSLRKV